MKDEGTETGATPGEKACNACSAVWGESGPNLDQTCTESVPNSYQKGPFYVAPRNDTDLRTTLFKISPYGVFGAKNTAPEDTPQGAILINLIWLQVTMLLVDAARMFLKNMRARERPGVIKIDA